MQNLFKLLDLNCDGRITIEDFIKASAGEGRELFIGNLLVRIHFIIVMIRWTGLAPWEVEFLFPDSLTSTFICAGKEHPGHAAHQTLRLGRLIRSLLFDCRTKQDRQLLFAALFRSWV